VGARTAGEWLLKNHFRLEGSAPAGRVALVYSEMQLVMNRFAVMNLMRASARRRYFESGGDCYGWINAVVTGMS
jgi:hypothetical protein